MTTPDQGVYWDSPGSLRASHELPPSECWALATTRTTGRLGFFRDGLLDIFPVNYFVLAENLYFRTSADGIIATSSLVHAAFQIDHADRTTSTGWTLLFNGPASRIDEPELLTVLWGKAVEGPWAPGRRDVFYGLCPTLVRGRRVDTTH